MLSGELEKAALTREGYRPPIPGFLSANLRAEASSL